MATCAAKARARRTSSSLIGSGLDAVENTEHPEQIAVRAEQGDCEQLPDVELGHKIQICAGSFGGVFSHEYAFLLERVGGNPIVERNIQRTSYAVLYPPTNTEFGVFQQSDEAALKAEKAGGADNRSLHELVKLSGRTEFKGNLKDFMKFVRLRARHTIQLGIRDRDRAKTGEGRDQVLVFLCERLCEAWIDENCTV